MSDDDLFRLVLGLGFAVVFPIAAYYRVKSQATRERLNRREEGVFILLTLRPIAAITMLSLLAFLIHPEWMNWSSLGLPQWARWGGVGLGATAAALLLASMRSLGPNLTDTVVTRARHTLVTTGPHRWVRHPFYVATAMAIAANAITTANWFLALTGSLVVVLLIIRTDTEEQKLLERFGDDYRAYMRRTGRFFPRFGR